MALTSCIVRKLLVGNKSDLKYIREALNIGRESVGGSENCSIVYNRVFMY